MKKRDIDNKKLVAKRCSWLKRVSCVKRVKWVLGMKSMKEYYYDFVGKQNDGALVCTNVITQDFITKYGISIKDFDSFTREFEKDCRGLIV